MKLAATSFAIIALGIVSVQATETSPQALGATLLEQAAGQQTVDARSTQKKRMRVAKPNRRKPGRKTPGRLVIEQTQSNSMEDWPQTIDELENAYNCGPYADRESAKKCKE